MIKFLHRRVTIRMMFARAQGSRVCPCAMSIEYVNDSGWCRPPAGSVGLSRQLKQRTREQPDDDSHDSEVVMRMHRAKREARFQTVIPISRYFASWYIESDHFILHTVFRPGISRFISMTPSSRYRMNMLCYSLAARFARQSETADLDIRGLKQANSKMNKKTTCGQNNPRTMLAALGLSFF